MENEKKKEESEDEGRKLNRKEGVSHTLGDLLKKKITFMGDSSGDCATKQKRIFKRTFLKLNWHFIFFSSFLPLFFLHTLQSLV